ncbi:MAG: histidine kinase [Saprospiraceae bacterium]|nr:histidine kinase [Saprospiraceae bacterium]
MNAVGFRGRWLNTVLFLAVACQGWSQVYQFDDYQVDDGLSSAYLTDLEMDPIGYLWMATWGGGLQRFDGVDFEVITKAGMPDYLQCLFVSADGSVWAGGENAIVHFDGVQLRWHRFDYDWTIHDISNLDSSTLILCTDQGICHISKHTFEIIRRVVPDARVYEVVHLDNRWIAATNKGLIECVDEKWQSILGESTGKGAEIMALSFDTEGDLWFSGPDLGLSILNHRKETVHRSSATKGFTPTFIVHGDLGILYVGTERQGILIWQSIDSMWQQLTPGQLGFDHASDMTFDKWDNAWVATFGGGLIKYSSRDMKWHSEETGLSGKFVKRIVPNDAGGVWILYNNGTVDQLSNGKSEILSGAWASGKPFSAWHTNDNKYGWHATDEGLLANVDQAVYVINDSLSGSAPINDLAELDSVTTLTCSDQGAWLIEMSRDSNEMVHFGSVQLTHRPLHHLFRDKLGQTWMWGPNHLFVRKDSSLMSIDLRFGGATLQPTSLAETPTGEILVGTRDHGLFIIPRQKRHLQLVAVEDVSGLPNLRIRTVVVDPMGILWIGTTSGIYKSEFDADLRLINGIWLEKEDGITNPEINVQAGSVDQAGHVYFGTSSGVVEFLPEGGRLTLSKPSITIRSIQINDVSSPVTQSIPDLDPISYGKNRISVEVKAIDQRIPQGLQYFWRLSNYQEQWVRSSSGGMIDLLALPAGDFVLEIKAVNRHGGVSDIVTLPFQVELPLWRKPWFLLLIAVAGGLLIYLLYRLRLNFLLTRSREQARKLGIQNELLKLEQQALRLQMNPHFIFNVLQSIQLEIRSGAASEAENHLQLFAQLMRRVLDQSRRAAVSIEDELEGLRNYLDLEQSIRNGKLVYSLDFPKDTDLSFYQIPPMLIQPFVENAVKHGKPANNQIAHIHVTMEIRGQYVHCRITDNGKGLSHEKVPSHQSTGIDVTTKRLKALYRSPTATPVEIYNLVEEGIIKGVSVNLKVPLVGSENSNHD